MKAFFDKYKYILALALALVAVVIVAVASAVAGKDTAENSGISYSSPENSSFTDTASHIEVTTPETSVNSQTPPVTTVTDKILQTTIHTTVQTTLPINSQTATQTATQTDTHSTKPETTVGNASVTPASTTVATAPATPIPTKASEPTATPKPATTVKTPTTTPKPATTAKATTTTVKTSATTPKPITTTITTVTTTSKATTKVTTTAKTTKPATIATTVQTTTKGTDSQPIKKYDYSCTFVIECKTILNNKDKLRKGLIDYVPSDGIIFSGTVGFDNGESVYDILRRICDENQIQTEASFTPAFGSYYVEGINNLYEFDCGGGSGWMYSVNGVFPNYGCSSYNPKNNDKIAFRYTCELGYDL